MIRLVEISSRIFVRVRVWQTQFDLEHCFLSQCDILSIPAILASENRFWSWGLSCCAAWIVPERGAGPDSSEGAGRIAPSFLPKPRYWLHQGEWPAEFQRKSNSGSLRICLGRYLDNGLCPGGPWMSLETPLEWVGRIILPSHQLDVLFHVFILSSFKLGIDSFFLLIHIHFRKK